MGEGGAQSKLQRSCNVLFLKLRGEIEVLVIFHSLCLTHILIYHSSLFIRNEVKSTGGLGKEVWKQQGWTLF